MTERVSFPQLPVLPERAQRSFPDQDGYIHTLTHTGAYTWEYQNRPAFRPDRGNFNYADMRYWQAFDEDQSARERRSAYITAVYQANDRERLRFASVREAFIHAAGRYVLARKTYWHQVEQASVSASWREARSDWEALLQDVSMSVFAEAQMMPRFDYLSGSPLETT